jgi:hypothetical protein
MNDIDEATRFLIGMPEGEIHNWLMSHPNHPATGQAREFLSRQGRFENIDREGEQVFPAPQPPKEFQTHTRDPLLADYSGYSDGT